MSENIPAILLKQRIRNRIIEYFSIEPDDFSWGTFEIINQWQDCFGDKWDPSFYSEPVFSSQEQDALKKFNVFWEHIATQTPSDLYDISMNSRWQSFIAVCRKNKDLFLERG